MCVRAQDLVGCQYRRRQQQRFPAARPTALARERSARLVAARRHTLALLPTVPGRVDIEEADPEEAELATLEALVSEAPLITNAEFAGAGWRVRVDILHRATDGTYVPIVISAHRAARPAEGRSVPTLRTAELGLGGRAHEEPFRIKHHTSDGYRLALATRALSALGLAGPWGGVIGQDPTRAFLHRTESHQAPLSAALAAPIPTVPRRVKECEWCPYQLECRAELEEMDDISLVLPGERAASLRRRHIDTVGKLVAADLGEVSQLAAAWREGIPVLRARQGRPIPRARREIDVDVEAYLDHGVYLWGLWDGESYHPFVTWEPLGGAAEAATFAAFWVHLRRLLEEGEGPEDVRVYCYSNNGENHWLRSSARRFAGQPGVPTEQEVEEFIRSSQWVDVFQYVREELAGPEGLGLKTVAPVAGYQWAEVELGGEGSVAAYRRARTSPEERPRLLRYNEDDCRATAAVRQWLSEGAPGIPLLSAQGQGRRAAE